MRIVIRNEIPESEDLRRQWNELALQMERPEVFYTYEWAMAVQRAYARALSVLLVLGYEGDCLIGVVALTQESPKAPAKFLTGTTADYCDFICSPKNSSEFTSAANNELRKFAPDIVLASVPALSTTHQAVVFSSRISGSRFLARPAFRCARVELASSAQRDQVRRSIRGKKLNRQMRLLSQFGSVQVRHLTTWPEISALLPQFRAAHIHRFQEQGRTSTLADPQRWHFAQELAELLARQGWMKLSCLFVGERVIAWNYGFQFSGSWFWYQPTFDGNFHLYSPGLCLLAKVIEDACDDPAIQRVDLGLGDEEYKQRFANGLCDTVDITLSSSSVRYARAQLRYQAAATIKAHPQIEQCVRWLLSKRIPTGASR